MDRRADCQVEIEVGFSFRNSFMIKIIIIINKETRERNLIYGWECFLLITEKEEITMLQLITSSRLYNVWIYWPEKMTINKIILYLFFKFHLNIYTVVTISPSYNVYIYIHTQKNVYAKFRHDLGWVWDGNYTVVHSEI